MSRSYQTRPRFTDPRDIEYLSFFGATERLLALEKTTINYEGTGFAELSEAGAAELFKGLEVPAFVYHEQGVLSSDQRISAEQQLAVSLLSRGFNELGFRSETKTIPESTGGVTVEMLIGRLREGIPSRRGGGHDRQKSFHYA